jgi:hypothetical protein
MRNVNMSVSGTILTITVDLSKPGELSSSGKTMVVSSTEGNTSIPDKPDFKVGLNVYTKRSS